MGAFFMYDKGRFDSSCLPAVKRVFEQKGFSEPTVFDIDEYTLLLYRKQLVEHVNYLVSGSASIYVVGTVVYKGKGYSDTISAILDDYRNDRLEYDELIGNYCLILHVGNGIIIINDALNVYELFEDKEKAFVTSSFLAAAESMPSLSIDRMAALEKLLTGYIVGQDTLFNEVKRIIPQTRSRGKESWKIHKWKPIDRLPDADTDRKQSIHGRMKAIQKYMRDIQSLAEEFKAELGLSGGYDSRILFAASQDSWPFKLDLHTHSTEGVHIHDVEKKIVADMAARTGTPLHIVPTYSMDHYDENGIDDILKDGYYFFDGRCAYNMGAFSPVYTRKYKCDAVSGHGLTLNGLGGEVYRNYYMNIKPFVSIWQWMKAKVYPDGIEDVMKKGDIKKVHAYICGKMRLLLPFGWSKFVTNFKTKRYYCEMRMPDCDALNCNAHNQMEFYLTPFIEKRMILDAYKGRKYYGLAGQYQADIITGLSSLIASFPSHYGFSFDKKEPLKYRLYMFVRGILPDFIWNQRVRIIIKKTKASKSSLNYFNRVREKSAFLTAAAGYTEKLFPEINFDNLRLDYAMMPNSTYVSVVFYMLKERIRV